MTTLGADGYAQNWLEYEKVLGERPILSGSAQDIVAQFNALGVALAAQAPPIDTSIETRDDKVDGVPVRIYTPPGAAGKQLPIGVYYHGGGLLLGSLDSEDAWCRVFSKNTPCIIVSVDYRLSQTHKAPAQLDDSITAYKWVHKNASTLGGSPSKIFTIGSSAGGGLALNVCNSILKTSPSLRPSGVVALVPIAAHPSSLPTKYSSQYTAHIENASGVPILDAASMKTFFEASGVDFNDDDAFVVLSEKLGEFPPVYIATCGKDPLRDDGKVLELILREKGVRVMRDNYEGVPHYFWMFPGIKGAAEFFGNVVKGCNWIFTGQ